MPNTLNSDKVPHSLQLGHCPCHLANSSPHAEHKKFGKPGETSWGTKKRLHGGGLSKANLTKKQADSIAVADREADKEKLAGPSGGSRRKR